MIGVLLADNPLRRADRAKAFQAAELGVVAVAEIADDAKSELVAMRVDPFDDSARKLAVAGNQDTVEVFSLAMPRLDELTHERPSDDHEQHRTDEKDPQRGARIDDVRLARPPPQQDARQHHRRHHRHYRPRTCHQGRGHSR